MAESEKHPNEEKYEMNKKQRELMYWLRYKAFKYKTAPIRTDTGKKIENLKTVEFFNGKQLIDAIMEHEKFGARLQSREHCAALMSYIMSLGTFFHVEKEFKTEKTEKKKDKKKFRLLFRSNFKERPQTFEDSAETFYMWNFEPPGIFSQLNVYASIKLAISMILYPILPQQAQLGGYYLGWTGLAFIGVFIAMIILRSIIFWSIWVLSFGRHHLYIFPNLTAHVELSDLFSPIYSYDYHVPQDRTIVESQ
ncbi:unnamed protein product [Oikopleura dioica]|uniref:Translocation protein SEC62 n=1 Tax=Oikopleura dioica TaxID=34765 RepID=E4YYL5_OIKDI|nr:unnamed protein product [Oikopleura dioica]